MAGWLKAQAALLLLGAGVFGVLFPILGLFIGITGLAPPGEDPLAPALGIPFAGCCTALIYAPCGLLSAVAAQRYTHDPRSALGWVLAASLVSSFVCPLGLFPFVLLLLDLRDVTLPEDRT